MLHVTSDSWMSCKRMVMVLLDDLFWQLWVGWNIEECFLVNQVVLCVPGEVLKF